MADLLTGVTEIDAVSEEVVSLRIQQVLTAEMVVWPLMSDYSDQVGPGMDKLKIPKFSNFTVDTKTENTAVEAQTNAFSTDDMTLDVYDVVQFNLEDIANLQAKANILASYLDQASKDMAAKMDARVIKALDDNPSTSNPDHAIAYNDATNEDLEKVDILEARKLLNVAKVPMSGRWGIINPSKEKDLLAISEFVRVDEAGSSAALRNGQIGRLFGFDIVLYQGVEDLAGASYFGHTSALAVARQMSPKIESQRKIEYLSDRWSISHLYGIKVLDSGKRFVRIIETP